MTPRELIDSFDPLRQANWAQEYFRFPVPTLIKELGRRPESFWNRLGQQRALALFHAAARRVPAYRDFLRTHRIRHETIRTAADLALVPPTDKQNYIAAYPLEQRCWDGKVHASSLVAMSSGTSGQPTFWPRSGYQEFEAAIIHELAYRSLFGIEKKKTLLLIGFPMGVYVSGVATLLPSWLVAQRGYDLTVVSVGNNKAQMLAKARLLAPHYEQTILVGHPFFIKDVIETGKRDGTRWKDMNLRMMFCSEGFTEPWRHYLAAQAGIKGNQAGAINTYGSSETLLVGHETLASIRLRTALEGDAALRARLAATPLTPNIFQYNPLYRYIENEGHRLLFTCASGIPLIRFDLHDAGRIIPFDQAKEELGADIPRTAWRLPFVTLEGRDDHTMIFYAANIYPEHIHATLNERKFLDKITGKFAMRKDYLKNMDEFLEINVELQPGIKSTAIFARQLEDATMRRLEQINMEYRFLREHLEKDLRPRVVLRPYQDAQHFPPGLKPRYIVPSPGQKAKK